MKHQSALGKGRFVFPCRWEGSSRTWCQRDGCPSRAWPQDVSPLRQGALQPHCCTHRAAGQGSQGTPPSSPKMLRTLAAPNPPSGLPWRPLITPKGTSAEQGWMAPAVNAQMAAVSEALVSPAVTPLTAHPGHCACHLLLLQASAVLFPKRLFLGPSSLTSASLCLWLPKVLSQSRFRPIHAISSPYVCTKNS